MQQFKIFSSADRVKNLCVGPHAKKHTKQRTGKKKKTFQAICLQRGGSHLVWNRAFLISSFVPKGVRFSLNLLPTTTAHLLESATKNLWSPKRLLLLFLCSSMCVCVCLRARWLYIIGGVKQQRENMLSKANPLASLVFSLVGFPFFCTLVKRLGTRNTLYCARRRWFYCIYPRCSSPNTWMQLPDAAAAAASTAAALACVYVCTPDWETLLIRLLPKSTHALSCKKITGSWTLIT